MSWRLSTGFPAGAALGTDGISPTPAISELEEPAERTEAVKTGGAGAAEGGLLMPGGKDESGEGVSPGTDGNSAKSLGGADKAGLSMPGGKEASGKGATPAGWGS